MSTHLYDLTAKYKTIEQLIDDPHIMPKELQQTLANIQDQIEDKVENVAKMVLELKRNAEVIKAEEKRLADRRQTLVSNME